MLSRDCQASPDITQWLVWFTGLVLGLQRQAKALAAAPMTLRSYLKIGAFRKLEGGERSTRYDIRLPDS